MSRYRRAQGRTFFFTVVLEDRSSRLLVDQADRFRRIYRTVVERRPFETVAICILPDHLHAIWTLPEGDEDFSSRWNQGWIFERLGGGAALNEQIEET